VLNKVIVTAKVLNSFPVATQPLNINLTDAG